MSDAIIQPGQADQGLSRSRKRRWIAPVVVVVVLLAALVGASLSIELNDYALMPGSACVVNTLIRPAYSAACGDVPLVTVPAGKGHPSRAAILLTDVSLSRVRLIDYIPDVLRSDTQVVPAEAILGTTPPSQLAAQDELAMSDSKLAARVAALRRLGYPASITPAGAVINQVQTGSPAHGRLHVGDVIGAVDGRSTPLVTDVVAATRSHLPGQVVHLTVAPAGGRQSRDVAITLGSHQEQGKGVAFIGVSLEQHYRHDFPFRVNINSANIGGPSAGLAFALAIVEELTPGDITGGHRIAATGTIARDGSVGEIGGVAQKAAAVRAAGGSVFLVPPGNYAKAKAHAGPHLRVIAVGSLGQALASLGRIGGDVPPAPSTIRPGHKAS